MSNFKYNNVFWFLIDGLCPDYLNLCGNSDVNNNFLDQLMSKGLVFNNVVTTASGTHTSMHSIFTSLMPSYNGATGWTREALRNFNQEIFTVADYFQLAGYETFRYCDADGERTVPMSGFRRWESSGYKIKDILLNTNLTKCNRRDRFIEEINICSKPKFVYHHVELLHELNGILGSLWKQEDYIINISKTAKEFEKLFNEYIISEKDLVIVSSDHGVILDKDFMMDGILNGERHYEQSTKSIFALIGEGIEPQIFDFPVSSLDEAPTILKIVLDIDIDGQGRDLQKCVKSQNSYQDIYFREKGTYFSKPELQNPLFSDVYCVREGKWKYVFGTRDVRCEWLINLEDNNDYEINLINKYPEIRNKYREMIEQYTIDARKFKYSSRIGNKKDLITPFFSLIMKVDKIQEDTVESLLDLGGPYYEVIVQTLPNNSIKNKRNYKLKTINSLDGLENYCTGEWIVYIQRNGEWSEYFLSDLYRYIQCHRKEYAKVLGENFVAVKKEYLKTSKIILRPGDDVRELDMPKKYILFGCGKIGYEALQHFGRDNVYCFADNNSNIVGKYVENKEIISFEMLKKIYKDYTVVISTNVINMLEIKEQFETYNIEDFVFYENIK